MDKQYNIEKGMTIYDEQISVLRTELHTFKQAAKRCMQLAEKVNLLKEQQEDANRCRRDAALRGMQLAKIQNLLEEQEKQTVEYANRLEEKEEMVFTLLEELNKCKSEGYELHTCKHTAAKRDMQLAEKVNLLKEQQEDANRCRRDAALLRMQLAKIQNLLEEQEKQTVEYANRLEEKDKMVFTLLKELNKCRREAAEHDIQLAEKQNLLEEQQKQTLEYASRLDESYMKYEIRILIEAGAVPIFIELLSSPHDDVQELAVWALGNIAGDSPMCRDHLLGSGILMPLLHVLGNSERITTIRNAVWTLSNLCRGKNPPADFAKIVHGLPILARLLDYTDAEVLSDTCWAISYLSDGPNDKIQAVIDAGVCRQLVELLLHPQQNVSTAALRAVGNIVTGDDQQTQVVLGFNALPCISHLLRSTAETIKKESCWTISNIAAGNREQIQAIINANIFPQLMIIMQTAEFKTRKEAAWAITNATSSGTSEQIHYLVEVGCVPPMCDFLTTVDSDIVQVALNALENILKAGEKFQVRPNPYAITIEECGGLDKIEHLQAHENRDIYHKSLNIIEQYFGNEEGDSRVAPVAGEQQFEFDPNNMPSSGFNF